ncbi:MAG TPA: prepilin-type N-terminal cleavage/methylation domain-containing protein [Elusimicrobiota bacterium]|nr:prepilin-type N-terminal cleavage/methylation domain-containing protein [Elusimicrobiota bacterium]
MRKFLKRLGRSVFPRDRRGFTFVEVLITATLIAILVMAVIPLFNVTQQGYTSLEVNTVLSSGGQGALNKIQHRIVENKRLFGNTTADAAFLSRVQLGGAPAALTGSHMPLIVSTASISPSTSTFSAGNVGNCLFFASLGPVKDLDSITTSAGTTCTVRVDIYNFHYYYVAIDTAAPQVIAGKTKRALWEWHSVDFADYQQLNNIADATKKLNVVKALNTANVLYAWDTSQTAVTSAFYTLSSAGAIAAASSQNIPKSSAKNMIVLLRGTTTGGFRYGISPNTDGLSTSDVVPRFATASGEYPGGFEVMIVGANSARQIFIRLVQMAQGSFKGYITREQIVLSTTRDLW